jgi:hypothetical protein
MVIVFSFKTFTNPARFPFGEMTSMPLALDNATNPNGG